MRMKNKISYNNEKIINCCEFFKKYVNIKMENN